MVKKILFVCKYNRFRSKFAEAYFNSVNKNKGFKAVSAGIIKENKCFGPVMNKRAKYILDKYGVRIGRRSKGMSYKLLDKADKVIVVANDVPKVIFDCPVWRDKVVVWSVLDVWGDNKRNVDKSVKAMQRKVDMLVRRLEDE